MIVFVSYQRADTLFAAHALLYALRLGGHSAFVDTGSIEAGVAYREAIAKAVSESNVLLALIGPSFNATRLHEPTSVVAFEWQRAHVHGAAVVPVVVEGGMMLTDAQLPSELRWFTRANALALRNESLSRDIEACVKAIPELAATPRRAARVLWVDDNPKNNETERKLLRPHSIVFDNVVSTEEAVEQLAHETYDLVITDFGRQESSDRSGTAGVAFLERVTRPKSGPPVLVYGSRKVEALRDELIGRGAFEVTASRDRLLATVLQVLGRGQELGGELRR
jgi:CheY-like chemotaxis protein